MRRGNKKKLKRGGKSGVLDYLDQKNKNFKHKKNSGPFSLFGGGSALRTQVERKERKRSFLTFIKKRKRHAEEKNSGKSLTKG